MHVLITGITGCAGSHLAEHALEQGVDVFGAVRSRSQTENLERIKDRVTLINCDLRDFFAVRALIAESRPDRIFHLAEESFGASSWRAPVETVQSNVACQINLFEAVRAERLDPLIHVAGSSDEYGLVYETECPVLETNPLRPFSAYAVSKVAQDFLGYQYFVSYGLRIVRTRAFNYTGPRRKEVFATSNFARQIAEIERGERAPVLSVRDLHARRDFSDVRDIARGYWVALEKGTPGDVYNLASGRAHSIGDVMKMLLACTAVGEEVHLVSDHALMRPSDVPLILGDADKITRETGWTPRIPLAQTLADLLDYWRGKVQATA